MNILSHAHLTKHIEDSAFTVNFLWDYLAKELRLDERDFILAGRSVHINIDINADQSEEMKVAKSLISTKRRRLSGIIVDVAFEYFLVKHWHHFSGESFESFIDDLFRRIKKAAPQISPKAADIAVGLSNSDWYNDYKQVDTLKHAFRRIGRRCSKPDLFTGAEQEIYSNYDELESLFLTFYPKMQNIIS